MMKSKMYIQLVAATTALFVVGCAEQKISELDKSPRDQHEFQNALANEYSQLAKKESRIYNDSISASHFAVKGMQSLSGMVVMPEALDADDFNKKDLEELTDLRDRLVFALERGGRFIDPILAAQSQVAFDCLVEETAEGLAMSHQKKEISVCHKLATDRIGDLETSVFRDGPVRRVHFDYSTNNIERDGMMTIADVAKRLKMGGVKVMLVGHADPIGKKNDNLVLSQSRADAVKKALMDHGVDAKMIQTSVGRGELKVSKNEFEPNNRVVDIYMF